MAVLLVMFLCAVAVASAGGEGKLPYPGLGVVPYEGIRSHTRSQAVKHMTLDTRRHDRRGFLQFGKKDDKNRKNTYVNVVHVIGFVENLFAVIDNVISIWQKLSFCWHT